MCIKPHHFVDMIKLHGAGCDVFVPDEDTGHAFYSVGNRLLRCPQTRLCFTLDCDDVCGPCKWRQGERCTDTVQGPGGYRSKDAYNKMLDGRLVQLLGLQLGRTYTAAEYCALLLRCRDVIRAVWSLEDPARLEKRQELVCQGCERYLARCGMAAPEEQETLSGER